MARERKATMRKREWEREIKWIEWTLRASGRNGERAGDGGMQAFLSHRFASECHLGAELASFGWDGAYVRPGYSMSLLA